MTKKHRPNSQSKGQQMQLVGYIRVSTDEQALSIEAQQERISAYCTLKGAELVRCFVDAGVSGGTSLADRPAGAEALAALRKADGIVAVKLDRLFRRTVDALASIEIWDRKNKALHLVDMGGQTIDTGTPAGRMFLTMLAGFAEFERGMVGERTKQALASKKARGERVGNVAFGYRLAADGVHLEQDETEQAVIKAVRTLRETGLSWRLIGLELEKRGMAGRTGRALGMTQIRRLAA